MSFVASWQALGQTSGYENFEQTSSNRIVALLSRQRAEPLRRMTVQELSLLLSAEATAHLEEIAALSADITRQRFGNTIRMFVPLYLSNLCANDCTYCGFSMANSIARRTLTMQALARECEAIQALGFDSVLMVAGEHERKVGADYFAEAVTVARRYFTQISLEVQPLATADYRRLRQLGLSAVYVYQETYDPAIYRQHHLRGKKTDINWRLETPERIAAAGIDKIGLGVLLGLADWRQDALACATHLRYLQQVAWRQRYAMAFPRLKPCTGGIEVEHAVNDRALLQLISAFRLFEPDLEIALSTRESAWLRDHLMTLGVTHMSAGSKTQPGGYADTSIALEQFSTGDTRSPQRVAERIRSAGLEPVWKDWQAEFS